MSLSLMRWASLFMLGMQASAISQISTVGAKFFNSSGHQFYIKGIAYQLTDDDPLVNTAQCKLDAALMKELGANTIRVYHVDPNGDHDGCMSAFEDAGIYLFVDLETFNTSIDQSAPKWNSTMLSAYEKVLDAFHNYDNLAGVLIGNEVLTRTNGSWAAPYVKAAARDVKAYRDSKGYRKIPVGYAAADIADLRPMLQDYLACSTNSSENVDFFSLNAYEWCGDNTFTGSGYSELQKNATGYSIPIFFSETGCNTVPPRTFEDQSAILGNDMSDTWSGAIIYEWIEEANNYGLISYGPSVAATATGTNIVGGFTRGGTPTPISPDFSNLKSVWATLNPTGVALSDYTASASKITPLACPAETSGVWDVNPTSPLPTLGQVADATGTGSSGGGGSSSTGSTSSGTGSSGSAAATSSKGAAAGGIVAPGSAGMTGAAVIYGVLVGFTGFMAWWL
ncbi:1,3-beta-glucanosyltransferase, putative [Talaromyces stipitatus ATCC 10500]|uniref:1,3-beta-glucanosyltransferase n=1 Tax=Talaromyces stipitatus (strain ATCC 10500 / CBS 375.48 / QM 6759 / NRRL 1006) TaxID=441959 RepID=B8M6K0_TALSN|nr:1,3-beta-glucanosyltransferase, putative [Talaromyces stipitatus ATCC 10500]EED19462.1 1,3-beta-glucanosyltransferase, putative [Talaromyces stipitatus ATCC 10500]